MTDRATLIFWGQWIKRGTKLEWV